MSVQRFAMSWLVIAVAIPASLVTGSARSEDCAKAKQYYALGVKLSNHAGRSVAFDRAVQLCPSFVAAHANLADAYEYLAVLEKKEAGIRDDPLDKAVEHYRKATELNPQFFVAYVGLGEVDAALGQLPDAKKACEKAFLPGPDFQRARKGLEAVQAIVAIGQATHTTFSRGDVMQADQIVREVKTSSLPEDMPSIGPFEEIVP